MADLLPLDIPPGITTTGTALQTRGRWRDGNLIRWRNGVMEPVGGWELEISTTVEAYPRTMYAWKYGYNGRKLAVGTTNKLYAYDGASVANITPTGLTAGRADTLIGDGYGAGAYGRGNYGEPSSVTGLSYDASTWSLDSWGKYLVAVRRDEGTVFKWDADNDSVAIALTNAPTGLGLVVTNERHVVVFGVGGDPRKLAWCDRDDYTVWTAAAGNSAGDLLLSTSGRFVGAVNSRYGTLVLTNLDAHVMRFVGQPYVYGVEREAGNCGLFGPNAAQETDKGVVWMGPDGFFLFNGTVTSLPCAVYNYVFGDINYQQGIKVVAAGVGEMGEVWWFYPSSLSMENNRYVMWNYADNVWSFGKLARSAWAPRGVFDSPLACSPNGHIYAHETGWTADGSPRNVFVESSAIALGNGDRVLRATHLINDAGGAGYTVTAHTRFTPEGDESTWGPYTMRAEGYTDVRLSGRQVRLRFDEATPGRWSVGQLRARVVAGGKR